MLKTNVLFAATALALAVAVPATAHRAWFVPSTTILSDVGSFITVDAAISNDLFYADHQPMNTDGVKVWAPDGSSGGAIQNVARGKYRSTFDVEINKPGTWRIGTMDSNVGGTFKVGGEDWSVGRRRGPPGAMAGAGPAGGPPRPAGAPIRAVATVAEIPADATDVKLSETLSRNEFYVTAGSPTKTIFAATGKGLEMVPETHPDELVANEKGRFRFLIEGKPAADLKVLVVPGGKRFRAGEDAQELKTGADGIVTVSWPVAGIYWINATASDANSTVPRATQRRMSFTATVEVPAP